MYCVAVSRASAAERAKLRAELLAFLGEAKPLKFTVGKRMLAAWLGERGRYLNPLYPETADRAFVQRLESDTKAYQTSYTRSQRAPYRFTAEQVPPFDSLSDIDAFMWFKDPAD